MEKKNIAQLLKDCPQGMELDCAMFIHPVTLDIVINHVDENYPIVVKTNDGSMMTFTKYGTYTDEIGDAKCVIYPKGKTTWEGFQRPFKDGDVLITDSNALCIYKSIHKTYRHTSFIDYYCGYRTSDNQLVIKKFNDSHFGCISKAKLATEEEKQKLFDAIKAKGYRWNPETKTLEKLVEPKFKVGDKVKCISNNYQYIIKELTDTHYTLVEVIDKFQYTEPIIEDKNWELVPNKFDITTLKPFDKVLVRDKSNEVWTANFYSHYDATSDKPFICVGWSEMNEYSYCIPYEANKELLGTTNDCESYYKSW